MNCKFNVTCVCDGLTDHSEPCQVYRLYTLSVWLLFVFLKSV